MNRSIGVLRRELQFVFTLEELHLRNSDNPVFNTPVASFGAGDDGLDLFTQTGAKRSGVRNKFLANSPARFH